MFNMGCDVVRRAFNLESQYRVIMLAREDWTKKLALLLQSKARLVYRWVQEKGGNRGWNLWAICRKKAQLFPR